MDSNIRSITKAVSWRFLGTLDTILISLFITKELTQATTIGFVEVFTKLLLFYLHERLWNLIYHNSKVTHLAILSKSLTWRIIGTIDTMLIAYLITGTWTWAISIASIELVTKLGLFYLHERVWENITWGRVIKEDKLIIEKNKNTKIKSKEIEWKI